MTFLNVSVGSSETNKSSEILWTIISTYKLRGRAQFQQKFKEEAIECGKNHLYKRG